MKYAVCVHRSITEVKKNIFIVEAESLEGAENKAISKAEEVSSYFDCKDGVTDFEFTVSTIREFRN